MNALRKIVARFTKPKPVDVAAFVEEMRLNALRELDALAAVALLPAHLRNSDTAEALRANPPSRFDDTTNEGLADCIRWWVEFSGGFIIPLPVAYHRRLILALFNGQKVAIACSVDYQEITPIDFDIAAKLSDARHYLARDFSSARMFLDSLTAEGRSA